MTPLKIILMTSTIFTNLKSENHFFGEYIQLSLSQREKSEDKQAANLPTTSPITSQQPHITPHPHTPQLITKVFIFRTTFQSLCRSLPTILPTLWTSLTNW